MAKSIAFVIKMSIVLNFFKNRNAIELSCISFIAYLLFYTMYDKTTKTLVPANLLEVLLVTHSKRKTSKELNKVISLSGASLLFMAFIPIFNRESYQILIIAYFHLEVHAIYSLYEYFDIITGNKRYKQLSLIFGVVGQLLLGGWFWNYILQKTLVYSIIFGILHFYFMEIDHKFILRVRPFAYIVFPLAILGLYNGFFMS